MGDAVGAVDWLTRSWEVTVRLDPLWTVILLIGAIAVVCGPPLAVNALWVLRLRRARQATAAFHRLVDALPCGVVLAQPDGRVVLLNGQAADLWPGLAPGALLPDAMARPPGSEGTVTSRLVDAPGGKRLAVRTHPLATRRGWETLVVLEDATRRQEEADFVTALIRQVSHELKTPLSVIRGHASRFAEADVTDPAEARRAWAVVDDEATRLTGLIDQAILMARFEMPNPPIEARPLNLRAVCEEVVLDLAERAAREGSEVDLEAEDGAYHVRGDRGALRQMLLNLVDNALKYGGPGVRVVLGLRQDPVAGRVILTVRDSGPGIDAVDLPLVFERGFRGGQARGSRVGSGLGLALVRSIVTWHGGTVEAASAPGQGTTITVQLPRHDAGGSVAAPGAAVAVGERGQ